MVSGTSAREIVRCLSCFCNFDALQRFQLETRGFPSVPVAELG